MTYSIVARCPETGKLGVAVQSHFFGVGVVVPWLEAGVGAVATQATAEISHGPDGLGRLRAGRTPSEALADILGPDAQREVRQVAMVDVAGRAAVHTGAMCIAHAGHVVGEGFAVQANMMASAGVPDAMASAFETTSGDLAARLLAALDAAEVAGGDIRGQQSAALVITRGEPSGKAGHDVVVDVRVDDHPRPLDELRRLVGLMQAYRRIDEADESLAAGDLDRALAVYAASIAAQPGVLEFPFWQAVVLAGLGRAEEAQAAARPVFSGANGDRWRELVRRLPATGLLGDAEAALLADTV